MPSPPAEAGRSGRPARRVAWALPIALCAVALGRCSAYARAPKPRSSATRPSAARVSVAPAPAPEVDFWVRTKRAASGSK